MGCSTDEEPLCEGFRVEPRLQILIERPILTIKSTSNTTDTVTAVFTSQARDGVLAIDMNSDSMNLVLESDSGVVGVLHLDYVLKPRNCSWQDEFNLYFDTINIQQTNGRPITTITEFHLGLQPFDPSVNYAPWINNGYLVIGF